MEQLRVVLDGHEFDKVVRGLDGVPTLKEGGDQAIIVKKGGTVAGNAVAVTTFTVELPDGTLARAQCVNTVKNLINALKIMEGWRNGGHI